MNELNTLAQRLRYAMDVLPPKKIKGVDLARVVGVKPPSVSDWLSGKSKTMEGENLLRVAKYLNINPVWLATGKGDFRNNSNNLDNNIDLKDKIQNLGKFIPVISWIAAGSWTSIECIPTDTLFDEWLPPNPKCGKNGYGLIVSGESMLPKFEPDDRIYVNPDFQVNDLKTGDLVIVACDGEKEATFKKLVIENEGMYLEPLNPKWHDKIMELHEGCRLVGKVVGLYRNIN